MTFIEVPADQYRAELEFMRAYGTVKWSGTSVYENVSRLEQAWDALVLRSGTLAHFLADLDQAIASSSDPIEDPLSGELIPATQDAELERMGREIAEGGAERQRIVEQLEDWVLGTAQEWMRYGDFAGDGDSTFQARVNWQDDQGAFTLGESQYGSEYGAFRLKVSVEDLGPVPPLGPENDPAQIEEMREEPPQWYARTMADVRPGDLIRPKPGAPSSEVTARCWPPTDDVRGRGSWHVIEGEGGHWDDHVIQPGECCVHLDGAGHRLFRPTFGVEILLAPSEVQAIELLGGWEHRERMITE